MRKRRTVVVDFCRPRQAKRKTPLAVAWVLASMLAATSTMLMICEEPLGSYSVRSV